MKERRQSLRRRSHLHGRVCFNLPCVIRDISYEGARIELREPIDVPDVIDLHIPSKKSMMHAIVRWRHGKSIGVSLL
jgi:PilZ domain